MAGVCDVGGVCDEDYGEGSEEEPSPETLCGGDHGCRGHSGWCVCGLFWVCDVCSLCVMWLVCVSCSVSRVFYVCDVWCMWTVLCHVCSMCVAWVLCVSRVFCM